MKKTIILLSAFLLFLYPLRAVNKDHLRLDPSIDVSGWLGSFSTAIGTPSESQSLTVIGTELTSEILVTPLAGFAYSENDTTWADSLSLPNTYNGFIYIRLKGDTLGTFQGFMSFTSTGAQQVDKYLSGLVHPLIPVISVEGWIGQFTTMVGNPSESQFLMVIGENLSDSIAVSPLAGFEFSLDENIWADSLSLRLDFNDPVYIRLKGLELGSYEGTISFSSPGATQVNRALYGQVTPLIPIITVEGWLGWFVTTVGTPSESQEINITSRNLSDSLQVHSLAGYEYSENDTLWVDSLSLSSSFAGSIYIRLKGEMEGTIVDTLRITSLGAGSAGVILRGQVNPVIRKVQHEGSFTPFSTMVGTPSPSQWIVISGMNLILDILIMPLSGYSYSTDNENWSDSLSLSPTYDGRLYVRMTGQEIGSYSGFIFLTSTGALQDSISVSGNVDPLTPILHVFGECSLFFTTPGTNSNAQSLLVYGENLTGNINVNPLPGYEYSTTNSDPWTSGLSLDTNFNDSIYVRLIGQSVGQYHGNLLIQSTGAVSKTTAFYGWVSPAESIQPNSIPGSIVGNLDQYYASNAASPLDIPSYMPFNGINEIVHPDVLYFENAWNGYHYWMAYTPFPNNDATYENPCIAVSNDNVTWIVPPGLTNPVDSYASSANDYYSDTELVMDPNGTTMYLLYRRDIYNSTEKLYVKSSIDGITWSSATEIMSSSTSVETLISPAIIHNGNQYMMWTVDASVSPRMVRLRAANSIYGPWSEPEVTNIRPLTYDAYGVPQTESWHINVTQVGTQYWMINNDTPIGYTNGTNLYLGISNDGLQWSFGSHPVLSQRYNFQYWDQRLYRASIIPLNDGQQQGIRIWYSVMRKANNVDPPWRIGYTEAWCAPRNVRMTAGIGDNATLAWDALASVYLKTTSYKVQQTSTPFNDNSWQDATSWSGNLTYPFVRNAFMKHYYRVIAKIE